MKLFSIRQLIVSGLFLFCLPFFIALVHIWILLLPILILIIIFYAIYSSLKHRLLLPRILRLFVYLVFITLLSLALIFLEAKTILFLRPNTPQRTIIVASKVLPEKFGLLPLQIYLTHIKQPINAVELNFEYNPESFTIVGSDESDSVLTYTVDKKIDNQKGLFSVVAGIPFPGFSQSQGIVTTLYLRVNRSNLAHITVSPSSQVIQSDLSHYNLLDPTSNHLYLNLEKPNQPETNLELIPKPSHFDIYDPNLVFSTQPAPFYRLSDRIDRFLIYVYRYDVNLLSVIF